MERQAMQAMMQHVTGQLAHGARIPVIKSEQAQVLTARAYTAPQVALIAAAQTPRHGLATELAYAAGLRAHELLTLRRGEERAADPRPALASKWQGRNGVIYTVHGKGGLVREVLLPHALAERLEAVRLDAPWRSPIAGSTTSPTTTSAAANAGATASPPPASGRWAGLPVPTACAIATPRNAWPNCRPA